MTQSKSKASVVAVATVGRETLEEAPARALKFLRGVGTSLSIRAALAARGYTAHDHDEGWTLLHAASGYSSAPDPFDGIDAGVRDAIRALDAWDEDGFRIVRATLERRFPLLAASILDGIGPSTGPASIVGVATLLERLDGLEKSKDKNAHAALALLAKRGIDDGERTRLGALVTQAQTATPFDGVGASSAAAEREAAEADHVTTLTALRAWYEEWSNIARASVKRRDRLILLGLAQRKPSTRKGAAPSAPAAPSVPARVNGAPADAS